MLSPMVVGTGLWDIALVGVEEGFWAFDDLLSGEFLFLLFLALPGLMNMIKKGGGVGSNNKKKYGYEVGWRKSADFFFKTK